MLEHPAWQQALAERQRIRSRQLDLMAGGVGQRPLQRDAVFLQMGQQFVLDVVAADQAVGGISLGRGRIQACALQRAVVDAGGVVSDRRHVVDHRRGRGHAAAERMPGDHQLLAEGLPGLAAELDRRGVLRVGKAQALADVVLPVLAFVGAAERQHHVALRVAVERGVEAALGVVQHARVDAGTLHGAVVQAGPASGQRREAFSAAGAALAGGDIQVLQQGGKLRVHRLRLLAADGLAEGHGRGVVGQIVLAHARLLACAANSRLSGSLPGGWRGRSTSRVPRRGPAARCC